MQIPAKIDALRACCMALNSFTNTKVYVLGLLENNNLYITEYDYFIFIKTCIIKIQGGIVVNNILKKIGKNFYYNLEVNKDGTFTETLIDKDDHKYSLVKVDDDTNSGDNRKFILGVLCDLGFRF